MLRLLHFQLLRFDAEFAERMNQHWFTHHLVHNPISRAISEVLFVTFILLLAYETLYWLGIYLGLWEYHAKDIFTEVPVHCAHVYVRVNVATDKKVVSLYYDMKQSCTYNILNWRRLNEHGQDVFKLGRFVKYHFEFSPEDFEKNPEPEFGSTILHLRQKVLDTFLESLVFSEYHGAYTSSDVMLFNNKNSEVGTENNETYLSKIHIETGDVVDAIVLIN